MLRIEIRIEARRAKFGEKAGTKPAASLAFPAKLPCFTKTMP
jgi:hypothetical protein